tara:strand:- start:2152 stop:2655 length:504 start_codon:yes stop_codon:yes gene_type:complete
MLISDKHRENYKQYYKNLDGIDERPSRWQPYIEDLVALMRCKTLLDYGCGGYPRLEKHMDLAVTSYDPALPGYDYLPMNQFDMVVCIDVLEHVEPETLDKVIEYLKGRTKKMLLVSVSTSESTKLLPDGSPWHCNVQPRAYWDELIPGAVNGDNSDGRDEVTYLWAP